MSQSGQYLEETRERWRIWTDDFAIPDRVEWKWHAHPDLHELLWGTRGALTAETDDGYFAIPGTLGLWIPAGISHRVVAAAGTTFHCTYIDAEIDAIGERTVAVGMPEVVRALLLRIDSSPFLDVTQRLHAEELAVSLLEPVEVATVDLPMPVDVRTRRVADAILADPANDRTIEEWGQQVGASPRNLSRLFMFETGLSFSSWRTRARMRCAIEWLAADHTVAEVSRRCGYATPSAFVHAFRRELGRTPGEFASVRSASSPHSS